MGETESVCVGGGDSGDGPKKWRQVYERTGKWWGTSFHNWQAKRKKQGAI